MKTEYNRYNNELNEISKFYTEVPESGQEVLGWKKAFKASKMYILFWIRIMSTSTTLQPVALVVGTTACLLVSKRSSPIKHFWKLQDERQNIMMRNKLIEDKTNLQEEKARMKVRELQTAQHITIATVATEQIQGYATSTTTSIAERFLNNSNERTSKRTRTYKDSNNDDDNEYNPFWAPDEKSSASQGQLSSDDNPFLISGSNDEFEIVTESGYLDEVQNEENGAEILFHSPRNYNEDAIFLTPNKRQMNDGRIAQYFDAMRKLLKYDQVVVQKPPVWTESLNTYIDNVLKKSGNNFKSEIIQKIDGDENNMFRLYCEKILIDFYNMVDIFPNLSRKIGERKYIVQNISSLFKFYEVTFGNMCFDWIESHSPASKLTKTLTNSGIVKVDIRGVRLFDDKEIFHVEVSGPPSSHDHAVNDTKKSLHTDILNLIAILLDHLRVPLKNATEIKVFSMQVIEYHITLYSLNMSNDGTFLTSELYSTLSPFSLDAILKYKRILYMMAIFHEEIMKQISIMKNLDLIIDHNEGSTVRDVLKIPKALKDLILDTKNNCYN